MLDSKALCIIVDFYMHPSCSSVLQRHVARRSPVANHSLIWVLVYVNIKRLQTYIFNTYLCCFEFISFVCIFIRSMHLYLLSNKHRLVPVVLKHVCFNSGVAVRLGGAVRRNIGGSRVPISIWTTRGPRTNRAPLPWTPLHAFLLWVTPWP